MNEFRTSDLTEIKTFLDTMSKKIDVALRKRSDLLSNNTSAMNNVAMINDALKNPDDYYLCRVGRFELTISYRLGKYYDISNGDVVYNSKNFGYGIYFCQLFGDNLDISSIFPRLPRYRDNHIYIGSFDNLSDCLTYFFEIVVKCFEELLQKKSNIEIIRSLF